MLDDKLQRRINELLNNTGFNQKWHFDSFIHNSNTFHVWNNLLQYDWVLSNTTNIQCCISTTLLKPVRIFFPFPLSSNVIPTKHYPQLPPYTPVNTSPSHFLYTAQSVTNDASPSVHTRVSVSPVGASYKTGLKNSYGPIQDLFQPGRGG